jgi:Domain of unknown function (DUF4082)
MIKQFPARTFMQIFPTKSFPKLALALLSTCCVMFVTSSSKTTAAPSSVTIWPSTATPALPADPDTQATELGVKFRSDLNGVITGIRFYKSSSNTGTHIGTLWDSTGKKLAQATFSNETASGWQQVTFSTPVTITANTVYVASYHTNVGHYANDDNFFAKAGVDNGSLHALSEAVSGGNGVYKYSATPAFPNSKNQSTNYWVDVVFATSAPAPTPTPTPPPAPTPTPAPTSTPAPAPTSVTANFCASENGFCSFSGTQQVRYGANAQYVTKTFTNGTACTNAVFGDPISGVAKTCAILASTPTSTPTPTPTPAPALTPAPTPTPTPAPTPAPTPTPTSSTTAPTFPLEVMGVGTSYGKTITINVPSNLVSQVKGLKLRINNLASNAQGKIQIGANTSFIDLTNTSVSVLGNAKTYGGIGGAFSTVEMILPLPSGRVVAGDNPLTFQQNQVNNGTVGYRVLNVDFVDANNNKITIPGYSPQVEDPSKWAAPAGYQDQASIAAGKALFEQRDSLKDPTFSSLAAPRAIKASCVDCHVKYGTDLKYYSFSNLSIIERAKFHGLSDVQGKQIAAYIRNNSSPAPGRPWNPPYQPGPGTDSKPIQEWAAGAGVDWVLPKDSDSLPYLFPNGVGNVADISADKNRSAREIPVALQFPDWNHWLPRIHPIDAWGDAKWTSSNEPKNYEDMRSGLSGANAANYKANDYPNAVKGANENRYFWTYNNQTQFVSNWTPEFAQKVYGTALWGLVKTWELEHEFGLEGYASNWYGANAESRIWPVNSFFLASPFQLKIPGGPSGIGGNDLSNEYFSNVWYHVQVVINDSYSGNWVERNPVDPPYWMGKGKTLVQAGGAPDGVRLMLSQQKFYYGRARTGIGPDQPQKGWHLDHEIPSWLVDRDWAPTMAELSSQDKAKVFTAFVKTWFDKTKTFTPAQYYAGNTKDSNYGDQNYVPKSAPNAQAGPYPDRIMFMIPEFRAQGVDGVLLNQICDWAKTVWPRGNWDSLKG